MSEKEFDNFQSEDCGASECRTIAGDGYSARQKPAFVKPELTCHGVVADLTSQLGGYVTPNYRPNPLRPNPFQQKD